MFCAKNCGIVVVLFFFASKMKLCAVMKCSMATRQYTRLRGTVSVELFKNSSLPSQT